MSSDGTQGPVFVHGVQADDPRLFLSRPRLYCPCLMLCRKPAYPDGGPGHDQGPPGPMEPLPSRSREVQERGSSREDASVLLRASR